MKVTDLKFTISKIKDSVALSSIIGRDIALQKKGKEFVGSCPFHHEKTASFFVNDQKGTFFCFGCKASGDMIEYLEKKKGITFEQAVERLAEITGIKLPQNNQSFVKDNGEQQILQKAVEFFTKSLKTHDEAQEYCRKRGIDQNVLDEFMIGYAPKNMEQLYGDLKKLGFSAQTIAKTGLNKFQDRIIFPILNRQGWPIAFGGRAVHAKSLPKYLNSQESALFQKRETIYGYNIASKNASKENQFIVVEGYIDVLIMHQFCFKTAVASMGTSFSAEHLAKVWKYSSEPIICFDGDQAGYNAMVKTAILALQYITPEKRINFCVLPENEDPDSLLNHFGQKVMQKLLTDALPLVDFLWEHFKKLFAQISAKIPEQVAKWKKDIFEIIETISNKDIKQLYKTEIKNRIFELLISLRKPNHKIKTSQNIDLPITKNNKTLLREAILLYTVIKYPHVVDLIIEKLSLIDFSHSWMDKIKIAIVEGAEDFDADVDVSQEDSENLRQIAEEYCKFDDVAVSDIVEYIDDIIELAFGRNSQKKEVDNAKAECSSKLDEQTWNRLKALKIYDISHNKNSNLE